LNRLWKERSNPVYDVLIFHDLKYISPTTTETGSL
jgi:hypothetical protein